jgi:hypothetical protein
MGLLVTTDQLYTLFETCYTDQYLVHQLPIVPPDAVSQLYASPVRISRLGLLVESAVTRMCGNSASYRLENNYHLQDCNSFFL